MGNSAELWLTRYCPQLGGQFVFLDPLSWQTHQLNPDAMLILQEAARAIDSGQFSAFLNEIDEAGGWPPGLEFLARSLATLAKDPDPARSQCPPLPTVCSTSAPRASQ